MADRLELRGLRVLGTHGALAEEQSRAQPFEVDVDVELDLAAAGRSDDLEATLDYGALVERISTIVTTEHHGLLERVAERIAEELLGDERVVAVEVAVRKLRPPVPVDLATAGVRVRREALGRRAGEGQ